MPHYSPMLWLLLLSASIIGILLIMATLFMYTLKVPQSKSFLSTRVSEVTWKW